MPCGICGAKVSELRRGRCWGCYTRWGEARPVGKGASCAICYERRRSELKMLELHGRSRPICHSCAGHVARLEPVPATVAEIRKLLDRERRAGERRGGGLDRRIFPRERRVGERRAGAAATAFSDTDPQMMLPDVEDIVIEIQDSDIASEQTLVRDVRDIRPPSSR